MARQHGLVPFTGTIGQFTGYYMNGKYYIRRKSSNNKKKMLANPRSKMTFQNANEFKEVVAAGALIRQPLKAIMKEVKSSTHHNRLLKIMRAALPSDKINLRGERTLQNADLSELKGYNFNEAGLLNSCLVAPHTSTFDAKAATNNISIDPFIPQESLKAPQGATHFKIITAASEISFTESTNQTSTIETELTPIDGNIFAGISHTHSLTPHSNKKVLSFISIKYYQYLNGQYYIMKNKEFNPLEIVDVNEIHAKHGLLTQNLEYLNEIQNQGWQENKMCTSDSLQNLLENEFELLTKIPALQSGMAPLQIVDRL